jgi:hypothetical protein
MLRRLHDRLGTAGMVIAVIALVAALTGTAFAANSALSSKQKKEVEKIAKKFAGKPGPAGAQGPAGSAGAQGPKGDAGPKGDVGSAGKEGPAGPPGSEGPEGPEGSPWTLGGVLPAGQTETGTWVLTPYEVNGSAFVPISFSIPLASPLGSGAVHYINQAGEEVIFNASFEVEEVPSTACLGDPSAPTAKPGNLCVYTSSLTAHSGNPLVVSQFIFKADRAGITPPSDSGAATVGAHMNIATVDKQFQAVELPMSGWGAWAVTAEE